MCQSDRCKKKEKSVTAVNDKRRHLRRVTTMTFCRQWSSRRFSSAYQFLQAVPAVMHRSADGQSVKSARGLCVKSDSNKKAGDAVKT